MASQPFPSPLRYPGGKRKVANYVRLLFEMNTLMGGHYAEPYAGGSSVALSLLFGEYASRIFINDLDPAVYAFWHSVLNSTEELKRLIHDTPLTMEQWHQQRQIITHADSDILARGFAAFYLNRTNRSGIIMGGVIGGKDQSGNWKLDARFNRPELSRRITKIARYRDRINLTNLDALVFLREIAPEMHDRSLIYLDPPYYVKGQGLYANAYEPHDHADVAAAVAQLETPWLVSYDSAPQIVDLYQQFDTLHYNLTYSAQDRYQGGEVMFFSPDLQRPAQILNPSKITTREVNRMQTTLTL